MNAQHTPGPWAFSQSAEYGDTRFYIAQADGAPYTPHYSDVATLIAETVSDERRSIQEANAQLIASAPDLLKALKECRNAIQGGQAVDPYDSRGAGYEQTFGAAFVEYLNAVITKATGEAV